MERKDEVWPVRSTERSVGARLPLCMPADSQQRGQHAPGFRRRSSGLKGDVQEFGRAFAVFKAFGNHAKRQGLDARDGFIAVGPVAHHAGQARDVGEPAAIILAFNLNRKNHAGTVPSGPAV